MLNLEKFNAKVREGIQPRLFEDGLLKIVAAAKEIGFTQVAEGKVYINNVLILRNPDTEEVVLLNRQFDFKNLEM